ncbi:hypothetical protein NLM24_04810 [Nocardia zapadnayensis]|nr:hypothetical protein [Nocardia zapadnayensis]MCX0270040.1 hypothetical protein [Nocardia zapadnayensis]
MTRRSPINDRVARGVVNRDSRRRVEKLLTAATRRETVMENLLWLLERVDDDPDRESIDETTRRVLVQLFEELHDGELLSLLSEDPSLFTERCRSCGSKLKRAERGRPPQYCGSPCRQQGYRRRIKPSPKRRTVTTIWLAGILEETVEQMAQVESTALQNQIFRSQMAKIEARHSYRRRLRVRGATSTRSNLSAKPREVPRK